MSSPFIVHVEDDNQFLHKKVQVFADPYQKKFEPLFSMAISYQAWDKAGSQKVLAAEVAKHVGKTVAKMVENEVYQVLAGGPTGENLNKIIHEHQAEMMKMYSAPPIWDSMNMELILGLDPGLKKDEFVITATDNYLEWSDHDTPVMADLKAYKAQLVKYAGYAKYDYPPDGAFGGVHPSLATLEKSIPGFREMKQPCPVSDCQGYDGKHIALHKTIIHLNDHHKWKREEIADWLETLDHDLQFKTPEEVNNGNGN